LFAKEEFEPDTPNRFFFTGPAIAMTTALMTSAVIPLGTISSFGKDIILQATDIDVFALPIGVMSIVYGIMIGGWASNNKFSLIVLYVPLQMISRR
jgi:NADH-quinone oxidoreductase subunit H